MRIASTLLKLHALCACGQVRREPTLIKIQGHFISRQSARKDEGKKSIGGGISAGAVLRNSQEVDCYLNPGQGERPTTWRRENE